MFGVNVAGYELRKSAPNSPEEFFNRSEYCYKENGEEKLFSVVYLRFFEENLSQFVPYESNPLFIVKNQPIELKHIIAFLLFHSNIDYYGERKRVYISDDSQFKEIFTHVDWNLLQKELQVLTISNSPI